MNISEDIYTIISKESKKSVQIDLTTPFVLNSSATLINVPYEDILIKNSIGDIIEDIKKESLLVIEDKNDIGEEVSYYFLSLVDLLLEPLKVEGYVYNKLYPLVELEENEFGLDKGRIITGKEVIVKVTGIELVKTEIDTIKVVNYTNGNYIKRVDDNFTYYSEQTINDTELKNIVKLNSISIEKGSILIEEYYENGEDYNSEPTSKFKYINVNTIENPSYLEVDIDTYLQE